MTHVKADERWQMLTQIHGVGEVTSFCLSFLCKMSGLGKIMTAQPYTAFTVFLALFCAFHIIH